MAHKYYTYLDIFTGNLELAESVRSRKIKHPPIHRVLIGRFSHSRFSYLKATLKDNTWHIKGRGGITATKFVLSGDRLKAREQYWTQKVVARLMGNVSKWVQVEEEEFPF